MKLSRRILVLATVVLAAAGGCQKAQQQAEVSKDDAVKSATTDQVAGDSGAGTTHSATGKTAAAGDGEKGAKSEADGAATPLAKVFGSPKSGLVLTEPDDGKYVELRPGNAIYIKLQSNHATGYSWSMVDSSGTVLVHDGGPDYALNPSKKGGTGSGGTETWRFRAVRSGEQTMRLDYSRPWERNIPMRTFRFTATVSY